jgi:hypothetical protein
MAGVMTSRNVDVKSGGDDVRCHFNDKNKQQSIIKLSPFISLQKKMVTGVMRSWLAEAKSGWGYLRCVI